MVPAHNEQEVIGACLRSIFIATGCAALRREPVLVIVVLDDCSDDTGPIAREHGAVCASVFARNVGRARALGAEMALSAGARWLAFTDADSEVPPDWLSAQLAHGSDAVCGVVDVRDWGDYEPAVERSFRAAYFAVDGHVHIHGANLGVSAGAYRSAGGFPPLASSEDVALVDALRSSGASIAWSAASKVVTSARRSYRAPEGFGATLERIAGLQQEPPARVGREERA